MNFELPAEIYIRLAGVTKNLHPALRLSAEEQRDWKCVRLEYRDKKRFAIASNRRIIAIYYLGETAESNSAIHLYVNDEMLAQCEKEKAFNSIITVAGIPELGIVAAKTSFGYNFVGSAGYFQSTKLADWHNIIPAERPKKSVNGAMAWTMNDLIALNASSVSGKIAFPEFIDVNKPVILRDAAYPEWLGAFMPNIENQLGEAATIEPAELPKWW